MNQCAAAAQDGNIHPLSVGSPAAGGSWATLATLFQQRNRTTRVRLLMSASRLVDPRPAGTFRQQGPQAPSTRVKLRRQLHDPGGGGSIIGAWRRPATLPASGAQIAIPRPTTTAADEQQQPVQAAVANPILASMPPSTAGMRFLLQGRGPDRCPDRVIMPSGKSRRWWPPWRAATNAGPSATSRQSTLARPPRCCRHQRCRQCRSAGVCQCGQRFRISSQRCVDRRHRPQDMRTMAGVAGW